VTPFLSELARKLTEKWLAVLVLPGLLFVACCAVAKILGYRHWSEWRRLISAGARLAGSLDARGPVAVGLAILALLLAAAATGLAAQGVSCLLLSLGLSEWPPPLQGAARYFIERRRSRWKQLNKSADSADGETAYKAAIARNRIAMARPARPTWMGDRLAGVEQRVHGQYQLDLVSTWPRLWLLMPETTRIELRRANERLQDTGVIAAWGLLYLLLVIWWWPAAIAGLALLVLGWRATRSAVVGFADLIEAAVDVHGHDIATTLGLAADCQRLTPDLGAEITRILRKGA
jgi:hypothetical protein